MKKIWQKSLASMVSAALCLTAFVGCLTVNAADYQGTVTSTGASVSTEATQATVSLKLSSENAMNVVAIKVSTDYGTLASVNVGDYTDKNYKIDGNYVVLDTGKLFVEAIGNETGFTTADVVLTFNKAASVVAGIYPVQVLAFAGETAATWDEKTVNLAVSGDININVTASTPVCDHANATYDYSVVDGNCITKLVCPDCGNVETVATIASKTVTPNPVLASGLSIRFRIKQNTVTDYSNLYGTFTKDLYSGNTYLGESDVQTINAVSQGTNWQFEYKGIASNEMTSTIHIKIFATDSNGKTVLISTKEYALADYFKEKLADTSGVYTDAYKNFFADVLRYGACAQKFASYNTNLLPTDGVETTYGTELPTTFSNTTSYPSGSVTIEPNIVLGSSVMFRIRFLKSSVADYNSDTLKMTVDYIDEYGNSKTATGTTANFTNATNNTKWQYQFSDLCCAFVNDYITIKIWDGENNIASLQYSFQQYASNVYETYKSSTDEYYINYYTLCQAVVAYSNSAKIALGLS